MAMDEGERASLRAEEQGLIAYYEACATHYSERSPRQDRLIEQMEDRENENCLAGMACPACRSKGPFKIAVTSTVTMNDDGSNDDHGNLDWEGSSYCLCPGCGHSSTVAEFRGQKPEPPKAPEEPRIVIGLEGGLVTGITSTVPLQCLVFDYDIEGADGNEVAEVPNGPGNVAQCCPHGEMPLVDVREVDAAFEAFQNWLEVATLKKAA